MVLLDKREIIDNSIECVDNPTHELDMPFSHLNEGLVLELESQLDMVANVRASTRFGSTLLALIGEKGSGKSTVLYHYLQTERSGVIAYVDARKFPEPQLILPYIWSQLLPNSKYDETVSLLDNIENNFHQQAKITLLVDNVEFLEEDLIDKLWQLIELAQKKHSWVLSIIFSSELTIFEQKIIPIGLNYKTEPFIVEVTPLSIRDRERFLDLLVLRQYQTLAKREKVRAKAESLVAFPGILLSLGAEVSKDTLSKPFNFKALIWSVVIALLAVVAVVLLKSESSPATTENQAVVTDTIETVDNQPPISTDTTDTTESESAFPSDSFDDLPPPVSDQTYTIDGQGDERQRIVVPDTIVDQLIDDNDATVEIEGIEKVINPPPEVHFSLSTQELLATSADRYTIQLAALSTLSEVQVMLDDYQLNDKVHIHLSERNGQRWYLVTYSDYTTSNEAKTAIATLPAKVQSLEPWVKSLAVVHNEIKQSK